MRALTFTFAKRRAIEFQKHEVVGLIHAIQKWHGTWRSDLWCARYAWMKFHLFKLHPSFAVDGSIGWSSIIPFWKAVTSIYKRVLSFFGKNRILGMSYHESSHFHFCKKKGDWFLKARGCRTYPCDSKMTWHLMIGPSMYEIYADEVPFFKLHPSFAVDGSIGWWSVIRFWKAVTSIYKMVLSIICISQILRMAYFKGSYFHFFEKKGNWICKILGCRSSSWDSEMTLLLTIGPSMRKIWVDEILFI